MLLLRTVSASRRRPWALLAVGTACYALACALWSPSAEQLLHVRVSTICNALWLAFYPLAGAAIIDLVGKQSHDDQPLGGCLDGVITASGIAALGVAFLLRDGVGAASAWKEITELAYPIGDVLLAALLITTVALRGWRLDRRRALLAGGVLLLGSADTLRQIQLSRGTLGGATGDLLLDMLAFGLIGLAAWHPPEPLPAARADRAWAMRLPTAVIVSALLLVVYDHFSRIGLPAFALAMVTLVAATSRMVLSFRHVALLADARRQANTDELTALPNRRLFMSRLRTASEAARASNRALSVLVLDLDNFKQLNDTLSHDAGDQLLRMVGPRLRTALNGAGTVARLGGDEFAVLLEPRRDGPGASRAAIDALSALRPPFHLHGLALRLTGSVGIASFPEHADGPEELMKRAEVAMYLAKESRRGWEMYAPERDTNSRERLVLASDLAAALEEGAIEAHFQPISDAPTRRVVGAEALIRWRRSGGDFTPPNEFIPAAEHAGLSRQLTRRMLELALEELRRWRAYGHDLYVSVNVTASDLLDSDFPDEVLGALSKRGLPPCALKLEVTESSILSDPCRIGAVLQRLRDLGVGLALDDFGTGYSSLTHLRTLPVGLLKLDRSFVTGMCNEPADEAIVSATIQLARTLGLVTVAEGVEDEVTWKALNALGCDHVQGHAVSRPLAAVDFERRLNRVWGLRDDRAAGRASLAA